MVEVSCHRRTRRRRDRARARDTLVSIFLACLGIGKKRKRNPAPGRFPPFYPSIRPHIISKLAIQAAVFPIPAICGSLRFVLLLLLRAKSFVVFFGVRPSDGSGCGPENERIKPPCGQWREGGREGGVVVLVDIVPVPPEYARSS